MVFASTTNSIKSLRSGNFLAGEPTVARFIREKAALLGHDLEVRTNRLSLVNVNFWGRKLPLIVAVEGPSVELPWTLTWRRCGRAPVEGDRILKARQAPLIHQFIASKMRIFSFFFLLKAFKKAAILLHHSLKHSGVECCNGPAKEIKYRRRSINLAKPASNMLVWPWKGSSSFLHTCSNYASHALPYPFIWPSMVDQRNGPNERIHFTVVGSEKFRLLLKWADIGETGRWLGESSLRLLKDKFALQFIIIKYTAMNSNKNNNKKPSSAKITHRATSGDDNIK